jgi:hypothetical protein
MGCNLDKRLMHSSRRIKQRDHKLSGKGKSILVFGIYLVVAGMTLLIVPNILLKLLCLQETNEVWIRIAGWLPNIRYPDSG